MGGKVENFIDTQELSEYNGRKDGRMDFSVKLGSSSVP